VKEARSGPGHARPMADKKPSLAPRNVRTAPPTGTTTLQVRLPNALSLSRLLATPIVVLLLLAAPSPRLFAAVLFVLASATDYLDGYLARRWKVVSRFGVFCDLLADKLLVAATLVALVGTRDVASWFVIIIVGRELIVSSLRAWAAGEGISIPAGIWGKAKTMLTLIAITLVIVGWNPTLATALLFAATILTLVSAIDYVVQAWRVAAH